MKYRHSVWMSGLVLISLTACVTIEETGEQRFMLLTPQQEAQMGLTAFQDIKTSQQISTDPEANAQVDRVAKRLIPHVNAKHAQWEVLVFENPTPNAFALPGGKIGVHTGLLPITQSDAGLATVIGHELAHVALHHGGQRISRQMAISGAITAADIGLGMSNENYMENRSAILSGLGVGTQVGMVLPFSRENEYEADRIGMLYMAKAGYDPREAVELWKRMKAYSDQRGGKPPDWLSTHPADAKRIRALQAYLPEVLPYYRP
ncbi:MAG: M48 family metallopeptidase [Verrucomicrobiota bacterium]